MTIASKRTHPVHLVRAMALSFGDDPAGYDRTRPPYPAALVDDLMADSPHRVLDVGYGTGIASRLSAGRGCFVLGVEPDERMAEFARARGATVDVAMFETWTPPAEPFDLVMSGTAWHWVDPAIGPKKAAEVLVAGGRIAVFWNRYRHMPETADALEAVYRRLVPHLLEIGSPVLGNIDPMVTDDRLQAIRVTDLYADPEVREYRWELSYTSREWIDHISTMEDHRTLAAETLDRLIVEVAASIDLLGGKTTVHFKTVCVTAVRRG